MKRLVLLVAGTLALSASGCGDDLAQVVDTADDVRDTVQHVRALDGRQVERVIRRELAKGQPIRRVRCPRKLTVRADFSVGASCTATTRSGTRVRIPVKYYPGGGIVPGRPQVIAGR